VIKELIQLHVLDTWQPMDPSKLRREEQMKALSLLLFLKKKQTGQIKGQACIKDTPQQEYIPKKEAATPTVSTESTFITAAIAASKQRKVSLYNVPSAFVNTNVDKDVLMVLKGELVTMMVQIAPEVYQKYITVDRKGTPVSYVHQVTESLVRADESQPDVLQKTKERTRRVWVQDQPIQSLHGKQGHAKWEATHSHLAPG
jgi:hypothetical protein